MDDKLSSLVDGELEADEADEAVQMLLNNPDFQARWHRYHVMKTVMHNELPGHHDIDITRRVNFALQGEPTVIGPQARSPRAEPKFAKPLTGLAVAATVAIVTLVGVDLLNNRTPIVSNLQQLTSNLASPKIEPPVQTQVANIPDGGWNNPPETLVEAPAGNVNVSIDSSVVSTGVVEPSVIEMPQSEVSNSGPGFVESVESSIDVEARLRAYLVTHSQFSSRLHGNTAVQSALNNENSGQ